jgi:NhaP-type Na+/H+ or K+/H+ antiporter
MTARPRDAVLTLSFSLILPDSYEVALGTTIGSCLGFSVRKVMKFCERKNLIDRQSFVAQYVSMAVLTIGE